LPERQLKASWGRITYSCAEIYEEGRQKGQEANCLFTVRILLFSAALLFFTPSHAGDTGQGWGLISQLMKRIITETTASGDFLGNGGIFPAIW